MAGLTPLGDPELSQPWWPKLRNPVALLVRSPTSESLGLLRCRLLTCRSPSPTHADAPDTPLLELGEFRRRLALIVDEFLCAQDVPGAAASIAALGSACFHDELAAMLLRSALDRGSRERAAAMRLLQSLLEESLLSEPQLVRGFEKLVLIWEDLRLDVPDVAGWLCGLLSSRAGLLDKSLFGRLPESLLQALCDDLEAGVARDTLQEHVDDLAGFKIQVRARLAMVLSQERSAADFAAWLRRARRADFHHEVVVAASLLAVDAPPGAAEELRKAVFSMVAQLQEERLLTDADMQFGFSRLLGMAGELARGSGDSKEAVVGLLRCAVERELLPAEFLKCARRLRFGGPLGVQTVRQAQRQTPAHSRRVWGSGDARHIQIEIEEAILEYFDSGSAEELGRIVEELHLSGKELVRFVRKLLVLGMEHDQTDRALDAVSELLGFFWTPEEVRAAFDQLRDLVPDLVLDLPNCQEYAQSLVLTACRRGILEDSYLLAGGISVV